MASCRDDFAFGFPVVPCHHSIIHAASKNAKLKHQFWGGLAFIKAQTSKPRTGWDYKSQEDRKLQQRRRKEKPGVGGVSCEKWPETGLLSWRAA